MSDRLAPPSDSIVPSSMVAARSRDGEPDVVYEVLAFVLADETYALPLSAVREIVKLPAVTEVPRAPQDIIGVISVRGRIITVLDLRRRLRMPEAPPSKWSRVLLVDDGREMLGLFVDRVLSVYRLRSDEVELAAAMGGDSADHVMGIGRPSAHRSGRGGAAGRRPAAQEDILILLEPAPLFSRR